MELLGLSCIFPSKDIKTTSEFYVSKLGFSAVEYLTCEEPHICLYRDKTEIILLSSKGKGIIPNRVAFGYGYDAYLYTDAPEILQNEFLGKNVKITKPLNVTDYGNKEFVIEDIDGRWIAFGYKENR